MDTETATTPQNGLVLQKRETEVITSIPPMSSVTPVAAEVERDNVVTETLDIAVFTATLGLPRVTSPARKTGRSRVAPAWQADYVMD